MQKMFTQSIAIVIQNQRICCTSVADSDCGNGYSPIAPSLLSCKHQHDTVTTQHVVPSAISHT